VPIHDALAPSDGHCVSFQSIPAKAAPPKVKEIKELRGGVTRYVAQAIPQIDAEIAENRHLWMEISEQSLFSRRVKTRMFYSHSMLPKGEFTAKVWGTQKKFYVANRKPPAVILPIWRQAQSV